MEILRGKIYNEVPVHNNVRQAFEESVKLYKDRIAFAWRPSLKDKEPTTITYEEAYKQFDALQIALYDPDIESRRVAIFGVNSYHWSLAYLATVCGLGIAVPLDPLLTPMEIMNLLRRSKSDTIICDARFLPLLKEYKEELKSIKHKYFMLKERESEKKQKQIDELALEMGFQCFDDLLARGLEAQAKGETYTCPEIYPDSDVALLFTSGTTSESKGVILSHYNITSNVAGIKRFLTLPDEFNYLSIVPIHHCLENTCGLHAVMSYGGKICYCDGLRYINQNLVEYKPHLLVGVPALYDSFYKKIVIGVRKQGKEKSFNTARKVSRFLRKIGIDLRRTLFKKILEQFGGNVQYCISGAAHQREEVIHYLDEIGIEIIQGYGLTECAPVVAGCNFYTNPIGTCGYALGGMEIAIDNEEDGQDGEILVKLGHFPNERPDWTNEINTKVYDDDIHIVMKGYYENEEATNEAFAVDGWFRTMDIGHFDPKTKGLVLTGRAKSMIVLNSGKKVFPEEIESKINALDAISDSLVWAEPIHNDLQLFARLVIDEEYWNDKVEQEKAKGLSEETIRANFEDFLTKEIERINSEMIKFKRIRHFYFSTVDIIKTTTRKIKRKPEIELIHKFFASQNEGLSNQQVPLNVEVKNLDALQFEDFSKKNHSIT